jgi:hypothetical protein
MVTGLEACHPAKIEAQPVDPTRALSSLEPSSSRFSLPFMA